MLDGEALHDKVTAAIGGKTRHQYGMGKSDDILDPLPDWMKVNYAQTESRIKRYQPYEGKAGAAYRRAIEKLTTEEARWANAFRDEMNVKSDFYAKAPLERRRWLERHYTAIAQEDSKRGERAARVVVHRTMHALEGEPVKVKTFFDFKGSSTGRMVFPSLQNIPRESHQDQADAYRYMLENISRTKS